MTKPTLSGIELNTVYTAHAENFIERKIVDQFYVKTPTLNHLRQHKKTEQGGEYLVCPLLEGHEPKGKFYRRAETVTMAHTDIITQARYQWAFAEEPMVVLHQDEQKARGLDKKLDLVEQTSRAAAKRLRRKLSQQLYSSTATDGVDLLGLPIAIPEDPTTSGAYGGLNAATAGQTWWANKTQAAVGAFATNGLSTMRSIFNQCSESEEPGAPTMIVTSRAIHEAYEALASAKQELTARVSSMGRQMADLGFHVLSFKGVPVVWDPYASAGDMWFLNDEAAQLVEMEGGAFTIFDFQQGTSNGLFARVTAMRWEGQMGTYERRCLGRMSGITT